MSKRHSAGELWKRCAAGILALVVVVTMARTVEFYIDGAWTDVTAGGYVLADDPITITDGADSQSVLSSPGSCRLSLYDPDKAGRWSNRVPGSPFYRKLGRNLPVRVAVDGDVRCVQEIPEWNPRWELGDAKVRTPIRAAGILRRLTEGARALRPAIERTALTEGAVAFWPLSDGADSTSAVNLVPGGRPMTLAGSMDFAALAGPLGQSRQPELLDVDGEYTGQLVGPVSYTDASFWQLDFAVRAEPHADGVNDQMTAISFHLTESSALSWGKVNLLHDNGFFTPSVNVFLYDASTNTAVFLSVVQQIVDGDWHYLTVRLEQGAGTFSAALWIDGEEVATDASTAGTIGRITTVRVPGDDVDGAVENFTSMSVANLAVYNNDSDPADRYQAATGYSGETAGRRIERLLTEEGVAFVAVGDLDDTAAMGPQTIDTLAGNLELCAVADQGRLYETRTALGLTYRTRVSLYNQYGPLLDYSAGHIAPPLEPTEDNTFTHNDVTVSRSTGSSARSVLRAEDVVDPQHTLSTGEPPDGVGTYDRGEVDGNVAADDQLQHLADWLRHLGTWDELRYPSLTVEFASPDIVADPTLAAQLAELEPGDQLRLDGLPAWLPPGQYAANVQGRTEVIGTHTRSITWNLRPGWPLEVWQMDSGGSTLAAAVASNGTSLKLATSVGKEWSTTAEPYYLQAFGNAMKVTALTTDTPAYIAAGTVAHGNNASVTPGLPAGMTPDVGQVILGWAAIRNSGTGVPDLPAGYTNLALFGNVRFFGKYHVTGDSDPEITFTDGVANADTSARLWGMSGVSLELDDGKYQRSAVSPNTLLNGSAANIAFPALTVRRDNCVAFVLAWKQDDWTSVATPGSMDAEIMDNATTTGDDQGIAAYYDIQTSATDIAAGSLVVTGGAAAISRATTVALRPLQTATVERGVNGVSTSIAAGEAVNGWRLGVLGL
jgi:hypothetical protein